MDPHRMDSYSIDDQDDHLIGPTSTKSVATSTGHESSIPSQGCEKQVQSGMKSKKKRLSTTDLLTGLLCMSCLVAALVAIEYTKAAIYLGQANQLIVLGFVLSLMSYCANRQLHLALLEYEVRYAKTTLQNMEALLGRDAWKNKISLRTRAKLGFMFALPVALGVLYKLFQGGETGSTVSHDTMELGLTGPPGIQNVGVGISLFINATLPWYLDPGFDRVYGFNMYVENANKSVIVDGPLSTTVSRIQDSLGRYESRKFSADVNAFVCELDPVVIENREGLNTTFTQRINDNAMNAFIQWVYGDNYYVGVASVSPYDWSQMWIAWWNKSAGEDFGSQVRLYNLSWQRYRATWIVDKNTIRLSSAQSLNMVYEGQSIITNNYLAVGYFFKAPLVEFDYKFRNASTAREKHLTMYSEHIRTDATLLVTMMWARITGLNSNLDDWSGFPLRYNATTTFTTLNLTLKKSWLLILVLAVNPAIFVVSLVARWVWLYPTPIGEEFGLISVLASVEKESLDCLKGAGLSGKLSNKLRVQFEVSYDRDQDGIVQGRVNTILGSGAQNGSLKPDIAYS